VADKKETRGAARTTSGTSSTTSRTNHEAEVAAAEEEIGNAPEEVEVDSETMMNHEHSTLSRKDTSDSTTLMMTEDTAHQDTPMTSMSSQEEEHTAESEVVDSNTRITVAQLEAPTEIHTTKDHLTMRRDPDTRTNTFTEVDKIQTTNPEEASVEEAVLHQGASSMVAEEANEAAVRWVQEEEVK